MADNNNIPKNTLKQWFVTGAKPQQAQYWSWLDSYWHKSESIPINKIEGLETLIENKADVEELANYAKVDASNIGPNQGAWRTALGINDITPPDVDLSNYYTKGEVDGLLENVTVDLTGYATESWVTTQTAPATQAEVEASTGTESNPTSSEPATEDRKFLSLFNFFKLIKKLRYIHLLPNSATAVANRLRSDGGNLFYANSSAVERKLAYNDEVKYEHQIVGKRIEAKVSTGSFEIDLSTGSHFSLVLTSATVLSIVNIGASDETKAFTMTITGAFLETLPTGWARDTYSDVTPNLSKSREYNVIIKRGGSSPLVRFNMVNV